MNRHDSTTLRSIGKLVAVLAYAIGYAVTAIFITGVAVIAFAPFIGLKPAAIAGSAFIFLGAVRIIVGWWNFSDEYDRTTVPPDAP